MEITFWNLYLSKLYLILIFFLFISVDSSFLLSLCRRSGHPAIGLLSSSFRPEGLRFVWDELAKTRPGDFPLRVESYKRGDFLSKTKKKKKDFELFWLTFSQAGRLSACVPK
jgi:hypothetical protein